MKLSLFLALFLPITSFAQDDNVITDQKYPNTFSSGSTNVYSFDNSVRKFNDWAISIGGGTALMKKADLTSFYDDEINWGWNAYVSLDKQISHTFGLSLQYQMGQTNQRGKLPGVYGGAAGVADAWTKYRQISLLGDVNFSNLLRRTDNHSPYRWALHGYAGLGTQGYETLLLDNNLSRYVSNTFPITVDQKLGISSLFFQAGAGVKYKVSELVDVELRTMYVVSGDDEFDGGGDLFDTGYPAINYNKINPSRSDDMFSVNFGLSFKLGKHVSHLAWYDPIQEIYYRTENLEDSANSLIVCEKGDGDNDAVCDDWDRELNTPAGARVDGAGIALDMDMDGIIDLYDRCVTVPGAVDNNGCPAEHPSLRNLNN